MVKCILVKKKDIEKVKNYLIKQKQFDFSYKLKVNKDDAYIPVNDKYDNSFGEELFDISLIKNNKQDFSLKEILSSSLTASELDNLISSYDVIGDIVRIEIPKEMIPKEKEIADAILNSNKSIKSVFKKKGIHSGVFRTQDVKLVKGVNSKETIHKENKVKLKLDISKSFFSPRLATERERIISQINNSENVLVMFSGIGPYPIEISKNTNAKEIYGIEINDNAYSYSIENKNINHANNVFLINGDVREIIPSFKKNVIGLKSSIDEVQLKKRIFDNTQIHELHLFYTDLLSIKEGNKDSVHNLENLQNTINSLKKKLDLFIHMPIYNTNKKRILANTEEFYFVISRMYKLCKKNKISAVIHVDADEENTEIALKKIKKYSNLFYIENLCNCFLNSSDRFLKYKKYIHNVTIDIAHLKIVLKNNQEEFFNQIIQFKENFNTYFHISDVSNDFYEGKTLFSGIIDFEKTIPLINKGILEVINTDETNGAEMLLSKQKLEDFLDSKPNLSMPKFDRIAMPLPKTAEEFLESAFLVSKNNTIIHLYDFLHVDEIKTIPTKKISEQLNKFNQKYAKNLSFKIIKTFKCGQYAPRTFRVCTDFIVNCDF